MIILFPSRATACSQGSATQWCIPKRNCFQIRNNVFFSALLPLFINSRSSSCRTRFRARFFLPKLFSGPSFINFNESAQSGNGCPLPRSPINWERSVFFFFAHAFNTNLNDNLFSVLTSPVTGYALRSLFR